MRGWCVVVALALVSAEPPLTPDAKATPQVDVHGDPLPEGALLRISTVRYRCGSPVDAALSPDGKTLAVVSYEVITLWDLATGRPLKRLRNGDVPPDFFPNQKFLCFSPDGKRLFSIGGWDPAKVFGPPGAPTEPAVHVWDVASGREVGRFDLLGGTKPKGTLPARYVWSAAGGKQIGLVLQSGVVRLLDASTGREVRRWEVGGELREGCVGVVASPDGKLLAVVRPEDESKLALYDVAAGREARRLAVPDKLMHLAFSPDGAVLAAADRRATVRLFDVPAGKELRSFSVPGTREIYLNTGLMSLTFSPDAKVLYAGGLQGEILRWRMPTGEVLPAMRAKVEGPVYLPAGWVTGVFPSADGRSLVSVGYGDGLIRRWDTATGEQVSSPDGFTGRVCARLSPDGRKIAVGDLGGMVALFDADTGRRSRVLRDAGPGVTALRWGPDGKRLAVGLMNETVGLWGVEAGRLGRVLELTSDAVIHVDSMTFSPDGKYLLTSHDAPRMFDTTTGRELWKDKEVVSAADLSPDGKTVAAWREAGELLILDAATGKPRDAKVVVASAEVGDKVGSLAFSPDGTCVATAHFDGSVRVWRLPTGEQVSRFRGHVSDWRQPLSFSPDGKWLLAGGSDKVIRLLEVFTGKELARLSGHEGPATAEFGAGLRTAVSASADGTVLVWDLCPRGGPGGATPASLWADLDAEDGAKVYRAVWLLADDPKAAVPLLREKLPPAPAADEKRVRQLVSGLDADTFPEREKAGRELSTLAPSALPLLKKLEGESNSAEVRRHLREVVEGLARREERDVRRSRAVQVLELAGTPEARQLLRDWTAAAPGTVQARESAAAVARLERRRAGG
jgi:WD40 repeat protein